jgi:hypothetical protein
VSLGRPDPLWCALVIYGTRIRWAASVLIGVATLGGCSASDSRTVVTPTRGMSAQSATTTTTTPSRAVPVLPEAATKPTRAGAEAFFRYFWGVYNYSYAERDATVLLEISRESCKSCIRASREISAAVGAQFEFSGGVVAVTTVIVAPDDPEAGVLIQAIIDQSPSRTVARDGSTAASSEAKVNLRVDGALKWIDGRWSMLGLDVLESGGAK